MAEKRLSELPDYMVARGHPDIRGWKVLDRTGRRLGVVEELIVDTDARRVTAAVIDLDGHDYALPASKLELDRHLHQVLTPYGLEELRAMPELKGWHSHERHLIRATFLPELADAPDIGELSREDIVEIERRQTQGVYHEPEDDAVPGEDPRLRGG